MLVRGEVLPVKVLPGKGFPGFLWVLELVCLLILRGTPRYLNLALFASDYTQPKGHNTPEPSDH